ncbi:MAG: hypothetical protein ACPGSL_07045 [Vicingaceae bacterium]
MKPLLTIIILIISFSQANAQDYKDLIITKKKDTIHCKIGLVNDFNIFYKYNPKKKKIKSSYISRDSVHTFIVNSEGIDILKKGKKSDIILTPKKDDLIEKNGIIYSTDYDSPPKLPGGINVLYNFLEENVRVYNRDNRVFGFKEPVILFLIRIDSTGDISNVNLKQSSFYTGGFPADARFLEEEITETILNSPNWIPAIIKNKYTTSVIYLPLKFTLNSNRIKILPSEFIFTFKNRE